MQNMNRYATCAYRIIIESLKKCCHTATHLSESLYLGRLSCCGSNEKCGSKRHFWLKTVPKTIDFGKIAYLLLRNKAGLLKNKAVVF